MSELQLYEPLDQATEDALRASIKRFGVIYSVVVSKGPWRPGCIIDGHHRSRLAKELGLRFDLKERRVRSEEEAIEIARTLNEDRRHLPIEERRRQVVELRREGHSERAIAKVVGASQATVHRDIERATDSGESVQPAAVRSLDGKARPAIKPVSGPPPAPEQTRPTVRGRRGAEEAATKDVMQPSSSELLRMNFLEIYDQFAGAMQGLMELSAQSVCAALEGEVDEAMWMVIDSTRTHDLLKAQDWFDALVAARPKPFSVVQGGQG